MLDQIRKAYKSRVHQAPTCNVDEQMARFSLQGIPYKSNISTWKLQKSIYKQKCGCVVSLGRRKVPVLWTLPETSHAWRGVPAETKPRIVDAISPLHQPLHSAPCIAELLALTPMVNGLDVGTSIEAAAADDSASSLISIPRYRFQNRPVVV
jgi:hypothetical protein